MWTSISEDDVHALNKGEMFLVVEIQRKEGTKSRAIDCILKLSPPLDYDWLNCHGLMDIV